MQEARHSPYAELGEFCDVFTWWGNWGDFSILDTIAISQLDPLDAQDEEAGTLSHSENLTDEKDSGGAASQLQV